MTQKPLISVVIPLYNKAPYIKRALDSVLSQTIQDFEIIVIGGKSTDGGENIVRGYADSRIRIVDEIGKDVSAARNQGIGIAQSDLVAFLDADDKWLPSFLDTILRLRRKYPDAGMYSTAWYTTYLEGGHSISKCYGCPNNWEGIVPSVFYSAAMDGTFPGRTSSIAIPKSILVNLGGFKEGVQYAEDTDLWARISLWYQNAHCTEPHICYIHEDKMAATCNKTLWPLKKHPFQESIELMLDNNILTTDRLSRDKDLLLFLERLVIETAGRNVIVGNYREARRLLNQSESKELRNIKIKYYISTFIPKKLFPFMRRVTRKYYRNINTVPRK